MATRRPDRHERRERCETCDRDTSHDVRVELRTENDIADHPEFSREPYRIRECRRCGSITSRRMNNA